MKHLLFVAALAAASPALANEKATNVKVYDHNKVVYKEVPVNKRVCKDVKVPVYETVQTQGDAAGGALAGMIIGGILGKGLSGNDDGAAAGAVVGGLIGADKGSRPKTEQRIVGYEYIEKCDQVVAYRQEQVEVYSHSTIRFYVNGKRYVLNFEK